MERTVAWADMGYLVEPGRPLQRAIDDAFMGMDTVDVCIAYAACGTAALKGNGALLLEMRSAARMCHRLVSATALHRHRPHCRCGKVFPSRGQIASALHDVDQREMRDALFAHLVAFFDMRLLDLRRKQIDTSMLRVLLPSLRLMRNIEVLDLRNNLLDADCLAVLADFFAPQALPPDELRTVLIGQNSLPPDVAVPQVLASLIHFEPPHHVARQRALADTVAILGEANSTDVDGSVTVDRHLQPHHVTLTRRVVWVLDDTPLHGEAFNPWLTALYRFGGNLRFLHLARTALGDAEIEKLAAMLPHLPDLQYLDLRGNALTAAALADLTAAISQCPALLRVALDATAEAGPLQQLLEARDPPTAKNPGPRWEVVLQELTTHQSYQEAIIEQLQGFSNSSP